LGYALGVHASIPEFAPLPRPRVEQAAAALDRALGPSKVMVDRDACASYATDESLLEGKTPDIVVFARNTADIATTLEVAERYEVPVTPRAGGTGRTGGAMCVAGGIVLATHGLAQIKGIEREDLLVVVEPGVVTGQLHAACEAEGLFYPPDPNSSDTCMVGGNLAENAGGPRAFKYGVTRQYVLGLSAVLMGGRSIKTGQRTVKGVTGYDLTSLLVGSEGTLAVFTEATLRLLPNPPAIATVLALFDHVNHAGAAVSRIIAARLVPRCLELLDAATLDAVRADVPIDARAGAMLLVEVDGEEALLDRQLEQLAEVVSGGEGVVDLLAAQDAAQRARLWEARKALSLATRRMAKFKLAEDIVVPRSLIGELLTRVDRIGDETKVRHLTYGHAGDGNLHVNFLWEDPSELPAVERATLRLMQETIALGGTLSGEHGIGVTKAPFLHLEQSEDVMALERDVKRVFDPKGLLNPGKIFAPPGHRAC
jgi:glycolate oxidase